VKFGILYNTDYYPQAHGSASQYYGQILEQTQLAEDLGFHAVWFGEHHYSGYSFGSPPVIAMAAAARTKRIKLGTGVSLIPLNHPLRLAEEYAMLDVLSGGRLEYGIGRGFLNYSYQIFGVDPEQSLERYQEGTDLIIKAWTSDGPFSFNGKFWKLDDYSFFPKPVQKAPSADLRLCSGDNRELHMGGKKRTASEQRLLRPVPRTDPCGDRTLSPDAPGKRL
jgi:alkanesulfonate monooxygenase SsuD/methylene tetrahydromethanopterin reductase-like flavin-dependent oxidoreductase (luciferase family)